MTPTTTGSRKGLQTTLLLPRTPIWAVQAEITGVTSRPWPSDLSNVFYVRPRQPCPQTHERASHVVDVSRGHVANVHVCNIPERVSRSSLQGKSTCRFFQIGREPLAEPPSLRRRKHGLVGVALPRGDAAIRASLEPTVAHNSQRIKQIFVRFVYLQVPAATLSISNCGGRNVRRSAHTPHCQSTVGCPYCGQRGMLSATAYHCRTRHTNAPPGKQLTLPRNIASCTPWHRSVIGAYAPRKMSQPICTHIW